MKAGEYYRVLHMESTEYKRRRKKNERRLRHVLRELYVSNILLLSIGRSAN